MKRVILSGLFLGGLFVAAACGDSTTPAASTDPDAGEPTGSGTGTDTGPGSSSSGGPSDDSGVNGDGASGVDAGPPNDPACPSTFDAPEPDAGVCKAGVTCRYPQGTCRCAQRCGGPVPKVYTPILPPPRWACEETRTDGCPDAPPKVGSACRPLGTNCTYAASCCPQTYACPAGTWTMLRKLCPLQ